MRGYGEQANIGDFESQFDPKILQKPPNTPYSSDYIVCWVFKTTNTFGDTVCSSQVIGLSKPSTDVMFDSEGVWWTSQYRRFWDSWLTRNLADTPQHPIFIWIYSVLGVKKCCHNIRYHFLFSSNSSVKIVPHVIFNIEGLEKYLKNALF
jgi:hypothetical protein